MKNTYIDKDYIENIINEKKYNMHEFESKSDRIVKDLENAYKFDILNENMKVFILCSRIYNKIK